jgi:hypothetical protein
MGSHRCSDVMCCSASLRNKRFCRVRRGTSTKPDTQQQRLRIKVVQPLRGFGPLGDLLNMGGKSGGGLDDILGMARKFF